MQFADLVAEYERLEATSKRLEMRAILVELLHKVPPGDLPALVYMMQGELRPEFEGIQLGVADSLAARAVAQATRVPERAISESLRKTGDLGSTVEELFPRRTARLDTEPLRVAEVYAALERIATAGGRARRN